MECCKHPFRILEDELHLPIAFLSEHSLICDLTMWCTEPRSVFWFHPNGHLLDERLRMSYSLLHTNVILSLLLILIRDLSQHCLLNDFLPVLVVSPFDTIMEPPCMSRGVVWAILYLHRMCLSVPAGEILKGTYHKPTSPCPTSLIGIGSES